MNKVVMRIQMKDSSKCYEAIGDKEYFEDFWRAMDERERYGAESFFCIFDHRLNAGIKLDRRYIESIHYQEVEDEL